ncbi:MAG: Asp-tRNA(Asn)/Glu-tRNA(Gln) amidotransferase subunit GatC [Candidatus Theseobacter exili]|nr:Asp-tRNA(Asn)/Glu-tRNA(Gln) amidotransferase subunit GatC [Candidatus Theseobacter exili]
MSNEIDIEYVSKLARLKLNEEEKKLFSSQLNHILDYIHQLNKLDTENIEPTAHVLEFTNVFREDQVEASINRDQVLNNAPKSQKGFFEVPRIIE